MFRKLIFGAVLLTACQVTKIDTLPHVVKVFEAVVSPSGFFATSDVCKLKTVKLPIFSQEGQSIGFEYQECPSDAEAIFSIKDGNEVFISAEITHQGVTITDEEIHLFSVWKTGPLSDEAFIESLIPKTPKANISCQAVKGGNLWKVGLTDAAGAENINEGWVMYPPLSASPNYADPDNICGPYSYALDNEYNIGVSDGIAIAYNADFFDLLNAIDLSSVIYENKG